MGIVPFLQDYGNMPLKQKSITWTRPQHIAVVEALEQIAREQGVPMTTLLYAMIKEHFPETRQG